MRRTVHVMLGAAVFLTLAGCASVAPWERDVHALEGMRLDDPACQRFERNVEVYREGAAGANGGKSGGGCGCT
ncbi:MAG TPA: DUF4266 domain-containing protein [Thermoanaerobaculia bacterium]|nr:DUF4266 domain-containing protein [Thermoanaerobaculia bacterium]